MGGHAEAVRIHDVARAAGVPVWCGGMLEAGVGRAHNVAIASLPGFSKPGDTSSSSATSRRTFVEPALEAREGLMPVPTGPGTGVTVRPDVLGRFTVSRPGVSRLSARVRDLAALFDARRGSMLKDLESLVIRESPSDESSLVSDVARWLAARFEESGIPAACVPCAGRGDALRVRLGPERGGALLLGHIDTVWPAGTLAEIPFRVEEGVARGPGVFDMKGGVTVAIAVLEAFARGDVKLAEGVTLFLTPDEEVGSGASRDLLVGEALNRDRVFVLEPSGDGGAAKIARKGTGTVTARFAGVAAHAGLEPEKGASALLEMSRFALYADALQDLPSGTSVVPTVAASGTMTNVVPEHATLSVDFRLWSEAEGRRVLAGFHAYRPADGRVAVTDRRRRQPAAHGADRGVAGPLPAAAALAADARFPASRARVGGASDGNFTASAGVPTLDGLGPSGAGAHARSEHLLVDDLPRRAALLAALLEDAA